MWTLTRILKMSNTGGVVATTVHFRAQNGHSLLMRITESIAHLLTAIFARLSRKKDVCYEPFPLCIFIRYMLFNVIVKVALEVPCMHAVNFTRNLLNRLLIIILASSSHVITFVVLLKVI